ncbi:hypothetical protein ACET3Z_008268 [Daucus carota]
MDIISDLPQSIIDLILTKLPIKDAVRTSILSSKWRYHWTTMTELVFDEKCFCLCDDRKVAEKESVDFMMRFLMLHKGPIQKFKLIQKFELTTSYLRKSTDIDQWLRLISRADIKELVLDVYGKGRKWDYPRLSIPQSIFTFQKLTRLTLSGFTVEPPFGFQGFPCLKYLELDGVTISREDIENFISGCPLLEKFKFSKILDKLALTIRAPNLKHLTVGGNFEDLYLEHTPLVTAISIHFYPWVWRGDILRKVPVTYDYLKSIEIRKMDFKDLDKVLYVLQLLLLSPNLQELQISYSVVDPDHYKNADIDIWERKCPADFTFKHLKTVKLSNIFTENDMEFVRFVLGPSPVLEVIRISPKYENGEAMKMVNEVLRFRRAPHKVNIL